MQLREPLAELFARSKLLVLDFSQINDQLPEYENLQLFFQSSIQQGLNPRLPENRQRFNDEILKQSGKRYLIGRYGEDRREMLADTPAGKTERTIHLGIDIFSSNLEPVFSPCDGTILESAYESGFGEYGNYVIIQPDGQDFYIFLGHLANKHSAAGTKVTSGAIIGNLGDYTDNENGGWSRHLHLQILKQLPEKGKTPIGYSSPRDFDHNSKLYPNPLHFFPDWKLG